MAYASEDDHMLLFPFSTVYFYYKIYCIFLYFLNEVTSSVTHLEVHTVHSYMPHKMFEYADVMTMTSNNRKHCVLNNVLFHVVHATSLEKKAKTYTNKKKEEKKTKFFIYENVYEQFYYYVT